MRLTFALWLLLGAGSISLPAAELDDLELTPPAMPTLEIPKQPKTASRKTPRSVLKKSTNMEILPRISASEQASKRRPETKTSPTPKLIKPFPGVAPLSSTSPEPKDILPSAPQPKTARKASPTNDTSSNRAMATGANSAPANSTRANIAPPVASRAPKSAPTLAAPKTPTLASPEQAIRAPRLRNKPTDAPVGSGLAASANNRNAFVDVVSPATNRKKASPKSLTSSLQLQPSVSQPFETDKPEGENQVQFDGDVPQLRVTTTGPNTLVVGKSARYSITLNNKSNFAARDVKVRCTIPEWVNVDSYQSSNGDIASQLTDVVWNVESVPSRGQQELSLDLTPEAGKAFELNVDVAVQPSTSRKRIAIQEPMLAIDIRGPEDAIYNQPSTWHIAIDNPGTGDAHDVVLDISSGSRKLESQYIGTIPAGSTRIADLELSSQQTGVYTLEANVKGSLGLSDSARTDFLCRRGKLSVEVQGSELEYAGRTADYNVVVKNSGDAVSKNVMLNLDIPSGMSYAGGLKSPKLTASGVIWFVDRLGIDEEMSFPVKLAINGGGNLLVRATATTADNLTAKDSITTESLISADLKLEVRDPTGPRPLGSISEYVIDVTNHGTDTAREITVIAVCAPEVEPIDVTGNAAIKAGQIFFKTIGELEPQHKVTYKVRAKANKVGTHAFRVIVKCYQPDLRLASEESTRYFDRAGITPSKTSLDVLANEDEAKLDRQDEDAREPAIVTKRQTADEEDPSY